MYSRKEFIKISTVASIAGMSSFGFLGNGNRWPINEKPEWLKNLIILNDSFFGDLQKYLETNRITDPSSSAHGGFLNNYGLPNAQDTQSFISRALCSLTFTESDYHHSEILVQAVNDASGYLLRSQHVDGTVDLLSHNFYSPPDTAFIINRLVPWYILMVKQNNPALMETQNNLELFIQKASNPLLNGGIHTPNHRWVFCAALGRLYELWPDEKYRNRAEEWLAEGIDIDDDGQYRERDTLTYSAVSNRALTVTAIAFDKPELLDYVRRNLEMLKYYILPNGQAVEEVSARIERQGRSINTIHAHYFPSRYLALLDGNKELAALCRLVERTAFNRLVFQMHYLSNPFLWQELPTDLPLPDNYTKEFANSGVVRIRRGNHDASIISRYTKQGIFFAFHKGDAIMHGMRIGNSFSGMGQFESEEIKKEDDGWVLDRKVEGLYFQPIPKEKTPIDRNWEFDDHYYGEYGLMWHTDNREADRVHHLRQYVKIREIGEGFEVEICVDGTPNVPTTVELIFQPGGSFTTVEKHNNLPNVYFLKEGQGQYRINNDVITFGPGKFLHTNAELRGTLPLMDFPTVLLTGVTPFYHTIKLT
ncbi:MAG: hypothetical protein WD267_14210 [Balneolales bacterium]